MPTVAIRRHTSDTPLARQHEHLLAGRPARRPPPIPWSAFERARYPEPALALAAEAERALAAGEYGAIDLFARIASALSLHGAPLDIVTAATRVPTDEARHAEYALRMASLCAGRELSFEIDPVAVNARTRALAGLEDLDRAMLEIAAVSETLAGTLLSACRDGAKDPVARAILGSILGDEVHHARLGWYYLAWRSPQWTHAERQRVADRAGEVVMDVEVQFQRGRDAPRGSRRAARALGVLDTSSQRRAVRRAMEDEIVPALDALGLGASHAWRARRRCSA